MDIQTQTRHLYTSFDDFINDYSTSELNIQKITRDLEHQMH